MASISPFITAQMPQKPIKLQKSPSLIIENRARYQIYCNSNSISDAELAAEMAKIKTPLVQRKEAMKKSREILFGDLCQHLDLNAEAVEKRWREMGEEEKMVCVRGFVDEWGLSFHPLSLRSVKELVEEHLNEGNPSPISSSSSLSFPNLKRMMGFSTPNEI